MRDKNGSQWCLSEIFFSIVRSVQQVAETGEVLENLREKVPNTKRKRSAYRYNSDEIICQNSI